MIRISKLNIPVISVLSLCFLSLIEPTRYLLLILISVLCHEAGHYLAMKLFSVEISSVTLLPLGIDIKPAGQLIYYPKQAVISALGPAINLILFFCFYKSYSFFACINLLYALFNLMPIRGLDGAQIIESILNCILDTDTTEKILKTTSFIFCMILWLTGIYILFILNGNFSVFALSVFLYASNFVIKSN
ncbi:MAG: hypothetical protein E7652_03550 [Ruminococcaceae bacterium]|nr:hypothetical protein [Oscillospiraceae bacterium]